jgi:hypothetical protein
MLVLCDAKRNGVFTPYLSREFSRGQRTILLLRSGASADRRKFLLLFSDGGALPSRRYGWQALFPCPFLRNRVRRVTVKYLGAFHQRLG